MLIYLAVAGGVMVLFWVHDADERERLRAYAVALGGSTALAFLDFRLERQPPGGVRRVVAGVAVGCRCSAARYRLCARPGSRRRTGSGGWCSPPVAGIIVAAFHALMWPHCLQRLEGVSPEVERLWLSHVKEARPFYMHGWRIASLIMALPATGAVGWLLLIWLRRARPGVAAADHRRGLAGHRRDACCCSGRPAPARRRR